MKEYNIYPYKNDLEIDNNYLYKTIHFDNTKEIKNTLIKQLSFFLKKENINSSSHIFIVGIGNDNYTADSIGPKTLKYIKVNSYLENFNIKTKEPIISSLEPGTLKETGILTEKIIRSVVKEIKPDIIILIDSFITDNINYLNKTIQINNKGLYPGCGIKGINSKLDREELGVPTIVIGVPTAVEIKFTKDKNNYTPYLLSTKDVDTYITNISKTIGEAINKSIANLK